MKTFEHKNHAFIGMFGSGKTEVAINYAINLKNRFENVSIADIDTISPYFRTRDEIDMLESKNIKVIVPERRYLHADVPIIPAAVGGFITNPAYKTVLDVGGNDDGAVVLGSLNNFVSKTDSAIYFVINTRRPFTESVEKILPHIERLSMEARVKVTYLVCNPNVMEETTQQVIADGEKIVEEVSRILNIPVAFTVLDEKNRNFETKNEKFVISRFMKKVWE